MRARALPLLVLALAVAGCGGGQRHATGAAAGAAPRLVRYHDLESGVTLVHPAGWRVYRRPLTQAISRPAQIALGTFPLDQRRPDANCTPATAMHARPPGGGLLYAFALDP